MNLTGFSSNLSRTLVLLLLEKQKKKRYEERLLVCVCAQARSLVESFAERGLLVVDVCITALQPRRALSTVDGHGQTCVGDASHFDVTEAKHKNEPKKAK
jgi:hypothetical protein